MGVFQADNLPIRNPKPDLHTINAHTKFGEILLMLIQVIIRKRNKNIWMDGCMADGQTDRHMDENPVYKISRKVFELGI